jgi:hypothetical protein
VIDERQITSEPLAGLNQSFYRQPGEATMTYGLYSGGSSMATRREWIEKAIIYEMAMAA